MNQDQLQDRRRRGPAARSAVALLGIIGLVALGSRTVRAADADKVEYNRDIRPILSENCYFCHGPDPKHREADLRLDIRDAALANEAFIPGNAEESELVIRVLSDDDFEKMPPPKSTKKLTDEQKQLLRRWVAEGAEYQPHWAFVVPKRPEVPEVERSDWVRNPIDAFILKTLESKSIAPSPEADRRRLLRRLSLDLTGLPPTPEQVRAFLEESERDPDAYERQVDRLLDSPHYGERMASPWLDLVRFADTVGYHGDQNQRIFPYRDYVIKAFNDNKPFDQFTTEQLAGDLLPKPTPEQLVATGFNRLNMMTREGGAQPKEYLAKYAADRVRTVAVTWMGATLGCAECHDHKFDPFTAKDFYSLGAFFADVKQWGVYSDYGYTPNPELKGFNNDYPFPPEIEVASPYLARRKARFERQIGQVIARSAARLTEAGSEAEAFDAWTQSSRERLRTNPNGWTVVTPDVAPEPDEARSDKKKAAPGFITQEDQSLLLNGKGKRQVYKIATTPPTGWLASIRLEALPHEANKGSVARNGAESALIQLSATLTEAATGKERPLGFAQADADHKDDRYSGGSPLIGVLGGWKTSSRHARSRQTSVWRLEHPVQIAEGDRVTVTLQTDVAGCVRLAVSPFGTLDPRRTDVDEMLLKALETTPEARTPEDRDRLQAAYLLGTGWDEKALARVNELETKVLECRDGRAFTMVTQAVEPLPMRVLPRGNWQDESGAVVTPAVPGFLSVPVGDSERRLTRLDLAHWITSPENPLTARVFVNRLWKQSFGTGLSAVLDDIGSQGEWPTHPELLDWLAVEFVESGWDVKHMVKLLVMSATYRQDSRQREDLLRVDPNNRLLAAQSPRRLEAEFVRDNALAIAGLLNLEVGGPSAYPYQPAGYYANLQFPNRDYVADEDDREYRRGLYTHWQRTFLHPMMANFDAPSREECTAIRTVANTPQQALTLLNDPTFVEASRVLAQKLLARPAASDEERINILYERALARRPRPAERKSLVGFLDQMRRTYRESPEDAAKLLHVGLAPTARVADEPELAAWMGVCRVVLNLHETITAY